MNNLRKYGRPPFRVVLVHGGPGAPGEMQPVAEKLSANFGVLEPLQTAASIAGQVSELKTVIEKNGSKPVVLIGWSWGAWLSYILSSEYHSLIKKLILINSGPFRAEYAKEIMPIRMSRLSAEERNQIEAIISNLRNNNSPDEKQFAKFGELIEKADAYNPVKPERNSSIKPQPEIYEKVWNEAEKLRANGHLLAYGKTIDCPVTVIHGDYDPHPYLGIKEPLSKILHDVKFILLKHCGHHPWLEREAKDKFYQVLREEIETAA